MSDKGLNNMIGLGSDRSMALLIFLGDNIWTATLHTKLQPTSDVWNFGAFDFLRALKLRQLLNLSDSRS